MSTCKFFKDRKLDSHYGLVQFCSSLKNLLVLIYSKLHSKSCDYLYKQNSVFPVNSCNNDDDDDNNLIMFNHHFIFTNLLSVWALQDVTCLTALLTRVSRELKYKTLFEPTTTGSPPLSCLTCLHTTIFIL